ncbi:hypothetical protein MICH65_0021 [Candidatus Chazhemtobacterium aquaticus]|uniref:Uncharacterized protein n=1 Tax=Candidatus Chazhemtobacterium aquaticus TaxID=2715735 RepID=A0A857NAM5_9BACT|nr:hypothetical protein MICH65_0021 [Candidatus Chazhemtobacterium aquaticus]
MNSIRYLRVRYVRYWSMVRDRAGVTMCLIIVYVLGGVLK